MHTYTSSVDKYLFKLQTVSSCNEQLKFPGIYDAIRSSSSSPSWMLPSWVIKAYSYEFKDNFVLSMVILAILSVGKIINPSALMELGFLYYVGVTYL